MTIAAPQPILDYYAAKNRHDIDAMLAPFAEDAVVVDEKQTYEGRAAIRGWMEETTRKYRVTSEPEEITEEDGRHVVAAKVSGDFPGSPVRLSYRFVLKADEITGLEIG